MSARFHTLIRGAEVLLPSWENPSGRLQFIDIAIHDRKIAALGALSEAVAENVVDARGLTVLPGMIDSQVHFREPGLEYKEDLQTGTRAALLGGITTVYEMPNTNPSTTTPERLNDKINRTKGRISCNIGFYLGATHENVSQLAEWERLPGCVGIKVFMGSSTGSLLLDQEEDLRKLLKHGRRRVALHAEDNARLSERKAQMPKGVGPEYHPIWRDEQTAMIATERAVRIAHEVNRPIHILHVSTQEEVEFLAHHKNIASVETTPQFLLMDVPEVYERLGTRAQMNPPVRGGRHKDALWRAVRAGVVDMLGSDHAPHTLEEKQKPYPESPSGMTGVQTILPLMLDQVVKGALPLARLVQMLAENPARLMGAVGKGAIQIGADADLTFVDLKKSWQIENRWIASRCGWTPYDGLKITGKPVGAWIGGEKALWDGEIVSGSLGSVVEFQTL